MHLPQYNQNIQYFHLFKDAVIYQNRDLTVQMLKVLSLTTNTYHLTSHWYQIYIIIKQNSLLTANVGKSRVNLKGQNQPNNDDFKHFSLLGSGFLSVTEDCLLRLAANSRTERLSLLAET